jgi:hypothetical protein
MQLTRTDVVFSRTALVSRFCAEIQLPGKIQEKLRKIIFHQNTHGARRQEGEEAWWPLTHRRRGPGLAAPAMCEGGLAALSASPLAYIYPPNKIISGRRRFSQIDFRCAAAIKNRDSEPETPFWHPVGKGIRRRSSSPLPPTLLHRPSMTPPSICE